MFGTYIFSNKCLFYIFKDILNRRQMSILYVGIGAYFYLVYISKQLTGSTCVNILCVPVIGIMDTTD